MNSINNNLENKNNNYERNLSEIGFTEGNNINQYEIQKYIIDKLLSFYKFNERLSFLKKEKCTKIREFFVINEKWISNYLDYYNYKKILSLIKESNTNTNNKNDYLYNELKSNGIQVLLFEDNDKGKIIRQYIDNEQNFYPKIIKINNDINYFNEFVITNKELYDKLRNDYGNMNKLNYDFPNNNKMRASLFIGENQIIYKIDKKNFAFGILTEKNQVKIVKIINVFLFDEEFKDDEIINVIQSNIFYYYNNINISKINTIKIKKNEFMSKINSLKKSLSKIKLPKIITTRNNARYDNQKKTIDTNAYLENNYNITNSDLVYKITKSKRGLTNLINSCYMNICLQILIHSEYFISLFLSKNNLISNKTKISFHLLKLLDKISNYSSDEILHSSLYDFKKIFSSIHKEYQGSKNHDPREFYHFLLEDINCELNEAESPLSYYEILYNNESKNNFHKKYNDNYLNYRKSLIIDVFYLELIKKYTCKCGYITYSIQKMLDLTISLDKNYGNITIKYLLDIFFQIERKEKFCEKCNKETIHTINNNISQLPYILIVSLQNKDKKNKSNEITYSNEELDLKDFVDKEFIDLEESNYSLYAIGKYLEEVFSEHKYAYIKIDNNWVQFYNNEVKVLDINKNCLSGNIFFFKKNEKKKIDTHLKNRSTIFNNNNNNRYIIDYKYKNNFVSQEITNKTIKTNNSQKTYFKDEVTNESNYKINEIIKKDEENKNNINNIKSNKDDDNNKINIEYNKNIKNCEINLNNIKISVISQNGDNNKIKIENIKNDENKNNDKEKNNNIKNDENKNNDKENNNNIKNDDNKNNDKENNNNIKNDENKNNDIENNNNIKNDETKNNDKIKNNKEENIDIQINNEDYEKLFITEPKNIVKDIEKEFGKEMIINEETKNQIIKDIKTEIEKIRNKYNNDMKNFVERTKKNFCINKEKILNRNNKIKKANIKRIINEIKDKIILEYKLKLKEELEMKKKKFLDILKAKY